MAAIFPNGGNNNLRASITAIDFPFTLALIARQGTSGHDDGFMSIGTDGQGQNFLGIRAVSATDAMIYASGWVEGHAILPSPGIATATYLPVLAVFTETTTQIFKPGSASAVTTHALSMLDFDRLTIGHAAGSFNGGAVLNCGEEHVCIWNSALIEADRNAYLNQTANPVDISPGTLRSYLPFISDTAPDYGNVSWTVNGGSGITYESSGYTFPEPNTGVSGVCSGSQPVQTGTGTGTVEAPPNYAVAGITRDNTGNVLGSVQVSLFSHTGSGVFVYVATMVSHATTGAYSFSVPNGTTDYMVYANKPGSPAVFDATGCTMRGE